MSIRLRLIVSIACWSVFTYEISDNTNFSKIGQSINEYIEKGDSIEELAGKLYIDHTLAWAIHLNGKTDWVCSKYAVGYVPL